MKSSLIKHRQKSNTGFSKPFFHSNRESSFFSSTQESENAFFSPVSIQSKRGGDIGKSTSDSKLHGLNRKSKTPRPTSFLQAKQTSSDLPDLQKTTELESKLSQTRGKGNALPPDTRNQMEASFGEDFSKVNIHTDAKADLMNQQLDAQAFTTGSDIYFKTGQYQPAKSEGKRLLAHELTHVVQQKGRRSELSAVPIIQRSNGKDNTNPDPMKPEGNSPSNSDPFGLGEVSSTDCFTNRADAPQYGGWHSLRNAARATPDDYTPPIRRPDAHFKNKAGVQFRFTFGDGSYFDSGIAGYHSGGSSANIRRVRQAVRNTNMPDYCKGSDDKRKGWPDFFYVRSLNANKPYHNETIATDFLRDLNGIANQIHTNFSPPELPQDDRCRLVDIDAFVYSFFAPCAKICQPRIAETNDEPEIPDVNSDPFAARNTNRRIWVDSECVPAEAGHGFDPNLPPVPQADRRAIINLTDPNYGPAYTLKTAAEDDLDQQGPGRAWTEYAFKSDRDRKKNKNGLRKVLGTHEQWLAQVNFEPIPEGTGYEIYASVPVVAMNEIADKDMLPYSRTIMQLAALAENFGTRLFVGGVLTSLGATLIFESPAAVGIAATETIPFTEAELLAIARVESAVAQAHAAAARAGTASLVEGEVAIASAAKTQAQLLNEAARIHAIQVAQGQGQAGLMAAGAVEGFSGEEVEVDPLADIRTGFKYFPSTMAALGVDIPVGFAQLEQTDTPASGTPFPFSGPSAPQVLKQFLWDKINEYVPEGLHNIRELGVLRREVFLANPAILGVRSFSTATGPQELGAQVKDAAGNNYVLIGVVQ